MKNLYTKNEFLNNRENNLINEGITQFIGNMFNKAKAYINKVKGSNEVDKIYNKYLQIIQNEFAKKVQVNLNLLAANKIKKEEKKIDKQTGQQVPEQKQQTDQQVPKQKTGQQVPKQTGQQISATTESVLNEEIAADQTNDVKLNSKTLKAKQQTIIKILNFYQDKALKEMDAVLKRLGGPEKNKDLAIYIDSKKDEFKLAFLSAEIDAYNQGGDKNAVNNLVKERNNLTKQLNNKLKNLGNQQPKQTTEQPKQTTEQPKQTTEQPKQTTEQPKQSRYDKLTDEQKNKYQELKQAWIEKQKQEGKNTKPGQGTRDFWYKQVGEVK